MKKVIIFIIILIISISFNNVSAAKYCQYKYEGAVLTVYETGKNSIGYILNIDNANKTTSWDGRSNVDISTWGEDINIQTSAFFKNNNFECNSIYYLKRSDIGWVHERTRITFSTNNPESIIGKKEFGSLNSANSGEYNRFCDYIYQNNNKTVAIRAYVGNNKVEVVNYMNTTDYEFNKKYNEAQNLFQTSYFLNSNGIFDCLNSPLKGGTSRFYEDKTNVIVFAPPSWMEQHKEVENVIDTVIADESTYNEQQTIDQDDLSCTGILAGRFGQLLKSVFNLIKTITPIIIVVLTFVDFVKALVSQDQKEFNKSIQKFIKRLIIGVLIFVLPTVLELILKLAGIPYGTCGIR